MTSPLKTKIHRYTLQSRNILSLDEAELYELTQLAGIQMDPNVFKIIVDLLKLNVNPTAVSQMLNSLSGQRKKKEQVDIGRYLRSHDGTSGSSSSHGNKPLHTSKGRKPSR